MLNCYLVIKSKLGSIVLNLFVKLQGRRTAGVKLHYTYNDKVNIEGQPIENTVNVNFKHLG
jgi:hypothetical protein